MINIVCSNISVASGKPEITKGELSFSLLVEGHSGIGKKGDDIFCAAVSALSQTMAITFSKTSGLDVRIKQEDGFLKTEVEIEDKNSLTSAKVILDFFLTGIAELGKIYPDELDIKFN